MMTNLPSDSEALSPVKRALHTVERMRAKLDAVERARTEPIALVGMGCAEEDSAAVVKVLERMSGVTDQ